MGKVTAFLKWGCLLPVGLLLGGFGIYTLHSGVIAPRTASIGACKKSEGCLHTFFNGNRQVSVIGFSQDGARFLSDGTAEGQIHDGATGKKLSSLDDGGGKLNYSVSGDRGEIVAYRRLQKNDSVQFFDWEGELLRTWTPDEPLTIADVVEVPIIVNGFAIASGAAGVSLWDGQGELVTRLGEGEPMMDLAASADGEYLAAYNFVDDVITVWPLQSLGGTLKLENIEALTLALSADGSRLAASGPAEAAVWRTADGEQLATVATEGLKVTAMALSEDGAQMAVGFETGEVFVVDVATNEVVRQLSHGSPAHQLLFDPQGDRLVVGLDSEATVSGGEALLPPRPGEVIRRGPGANLRQSENRISVKPGFGVVWSLEN